MTEKIRIDIDCRVDIDITPELKELLDKYRNTDYDDDIYDEINDKIYSCLNKELVKKGLYKIGQVNDWNTVQVSE